MSTNQETRQDDGIHATSIMMVLLLMGVSALFLGASAAYIYSRFQLDAPAPFPPALFYVNIPILLAATFFLRKIKQQDPSVITEQTVRYLVYALVATLLFIVFQIIGWTQFFGARSMTSSQPRSYLFILSGLHLLHVIGGIPFLVTFWFRLRRYLQGKELVDSARQGRYVKALTLYWNFLDLLWILLVSMLLFSALLS